MIATIIYLFVAFWLVALLIAAVADHPWLLFVPLLLGLGILGLAYSGDKPGRPTPVERAVAKDFAEAQREIPAMQYAIATYGEVEVRGCYDTVKARDGIERDFWTCVQAWKPLSVR